MTVIDACPMNPLKWFAHCFFYKQSNLKKYDIIITALCLSIDL